MLLTVERFGSQLRSPASRLRQIVDHSNELDDSASDVTKSRRECRASEPNEIRVSIVSDYRTLTLKTLNNIFKRVGGELRYEPLDCWHHGAKLIGGSIRRSIREQSR